MMIIEPAEPETPPAHSLGKVLWRGTGGEGGGKTCFFIAFFIWRGWWLDLFFRRFFDVFFFCSRAPHGEGRCVGSKALLPSGALRMKGGTARAPPSGVGERCFL